MWLIKEEFFQETVCTKKSFQEDNEGFVNGTENQILDGISQALSKMGEKVCFISQGR